MIKKIGNALLVVSVAAGLVLGFLYYNLFLKNINFPDEKLYVYVKTNSTFEDVLEYLDEHKIVSNNIVFR